MTSTIFGTFTVSISDLTQDERRFAVVTLENERCDSVHIHLDSLQAAIDLAADIVAAVEKTSRERGRGWRV